MSLGRINYEVSIRDRWGGSARLGHYFPTQSHEKWFFLLDTGRGVGAFPIRRKADWQIFRPRIMGFIK
jgi:hypothetical protein